MAIADHGPHRSIGSQLDFLLKHSATGLRMMWVCVKPVSALRVFECGSSSAVVLQVLVVTESDMG